MSNVTAVPIPPVKRGYILWLVAGVLLALVAATALAMQGDDFLTRNARAPGGVTTASGPGPYTPLTLPTTFLRCTLVARLVA